VPLIRALDPSAGPLDFFGAELRRWRTGAGLSQEQLGQRLGYSGAQVDKVETGERVPSQDFAQNCDRALPDAAGLFVRIYALARRLDGPGYPSWFTEWLEAERRATSLRWWEPMLIPGLLQTADYARTLFRASQSASTTEDEIDELVSARIERQGILDHPRPPELWVVLDEAVLHRLIGSRKVMYDQLLYLADTSCRLNVTVQIVPAAVGAHSGLLGAFIVAAFDGAPSILYAETAVEGQTIEKSALVGKAALAFDRLRADALPRGAARDLIGKVAEERWATT
jgi:transcriptional regulator with XRE-family HTH domain